MFGLIVGLNRWNHRVVAHAALTTDRDGRAKRVQEIIAARDARDQRADARDPAADQRDGVIDRAAFLSHGGRRTRGAAIPAPRGRGPD